MRDETPYTSPVGIHGYYEYIFSPVLEANGTVRAVVGTTREITDRKLTSSALEESRRRLALATESAQIGIWDWDALADKLVWDPQMYRLYGICASKSNDTPFSAHCSTVVRTISRYSGR